MKTPLIFIYFFILTVSCSKKQDAAGESKAPENKSGVQNIREEVPPPADVPKAEDRSREVPATGEIAPTGEPADTRDATPVNKQEPVTIGGGPKDAQVPGPTVKPTTSISTLKGGLLPMGSPDDVGGSEDPSVDKIESMKPPRMNKRAPKPDPQASGYHGMDQDEPTQE